MILFDIDIQDEARSDIRETVYYYDHQIRRSDLTERFLEEMAEVEAKIAAHPFAYSFLETDPLLRFAQLRTMAFKVIFEIISENLVRVYAVRHNRRLPFI